MRYIFIIFFILFFSNPVFAAPKITIRDAPLQMHKTSEFQVTFDVANDSVTSDSYYVKGRVGTSSATLSQGETFNPTTGSWLSDTSAWSSFPALTFSNTGIATASVTLRTKTTAVIGNNILIVRINKSSSYDSSPANLLILEPSPTLPTQIPTGRDPDPSPTGVGTTPVSYSNIYISEVMPNPPDNEHEWVELFNNNDFPVSLINWFVDDVENGGSSPKMFSMDIPAKNYSVFELSSSVFNNTGDSVRLLDFNKNQVDGFEYDGSTQGKTWGRTSFNSDSFCLQDPSKNNPNNSCINPTLTPSPTPTMTPTPSPSITSTNSISPTRSQLRRQIVSMNQTVPTAEPTSEEENILGASTEQISISKNWALVRSLSFASFSYSLLTILAVFLKMKRYGKNSQFFSSSLHS